jgi:heme-degrading monooxygenase HmoA
VHGEEHTDPVSTFETPPEPPYTAVIFTSTRTDGDHGYAAMAARMEELAKQQPGYLGYESAYEGAFGITVSYWIDEAAAAAWKQVREHAVAQERGRTTWYADYRVQVATVTRSYGPDDRAATAPTR